jgi:hypothetical protein
LPKAVTDSNGNWMEFFSTWMNSAHRAKVNTLGYSITALDPATKPTTIDPTFMPTFNEFQTCQWNDPSGNTATGIPAGNNNCLLYAQMTANADAPTPLYYTYTGNMVDAGETATLFISKKVFWDEWLLPQLTTLNYQTWLVATYASCDNNEVNPNWKFNWSIGPDAATFAGYTDGAQNPFYAWKPKSTDGNGPYGFSFNPGSNSKEDNEGSAASKLTAHIDCKLLLWLEIEGRQFILTILQAKQQMI